MQRIKSRRLAALVTVVAATGLTLGACSSDGGSTSPTTTATQPATSTAKAQTVVDIAAGNPDFSTLVAAVKAAGLVDTLSAAGPFTVFAPTNEAFAKLPAETLDSLLKPENKQQLTDILTYHVVSANIMAADVKPGMVTTVNGADFTVTADRGKVVITDGQSNRANVTKTDVVASNGVIHVIDTVLLPPNA